MSTPRKRSLSLGAAVLGLLLTLAWTGLALAADKYAPAPSAIKGWTEYAESVKDLRDPAHRNPKYPWMPKGPFPFKPSWPRKDVPYTGEELLFFRDYVFWGCRTQDYAGYTPVANRRGLIVSKNFYIRRTHYWDNYDQLMNYETKGGINGIFQKVFTILDAPPENRAFAQLVIKYNNAPGKWHDPDRYQYIPSLRRVRRAAGGDRQDDTLGYPASNDDNGERQWWEYTYEIIGEDVLCEVAAEKGHNMLGDPKSIVDNSFMPGVWGDGENPYREDSCVETWVVKATHKDPNYYLGYLLFWIEKRTKLELRDEQYDKHGDLWRIDFETTYRLLPGGFHKGAWTRNTIYGLDYKRDFWTMAWYFDWFTGMPIDENMYTHQQLQKEFFWREPKNYRKVSRFDQMPPYPPVYTEKLSRHRRGANQFFDPDLLKKMKGHNEMWVKRGGYDAWAWAKRTKFQDIK